MPTKYRVKGDNLALAVSQYLSPVFSELLLKRGICSFVHFLEVIKVLGKLIRLQGERLNEMK